MYYMGIDGGGTKTAFIVCDDKGNIIAENTKPTANYLQVGFEGLYDIIKEGVKELLYEANITENDIANAFVGCSGYGDVKSKEPIIEAHIKKALGKIKHQVGNDGENAMAGALSGKDGINIVAGTGSIAFGRNSFSNKTYKCGGWHQALGSDEGSAYWIAIELLKEFERQSDERDVKSLLYEVVKSELSLQDDGDVIDRVVEEWNLDRKRIASLSKIVSQLYDANDPYAKNIINLAAKELAQMVIDLYKRLNFTDEITVTYTGGVWKMGEKILQPFCDILKDYDIVIKPPVFEPNIGALILAMQNDKKEITKSIIANLSSK